MDINDLRKKRQKLENDIAISISALVEKFKKETGFSPCRISIDMLRNDTIGDPEPQYITGKCEVDIEI